MSIRSLYGLAAAGILLCSCQSNTYQIDGFARSSFYGEIRETGLYSVMAKKAPACQVSFFTEPGTITIELNSQPGTSRVSGTRLNNEWQQLTDSVEMMGYEVARLLRHPAADTTAQKALANRVDSLHRKMSACILNTAQRNKDNPLGKYINENYKAPEFK